jgi:hypothetical protein
MDLAYSNSAIEKYKSMMPQEEADLLPSTIEEILANYFDDNYIIGDSPEIALACTRFCLLCS